MLADDAFKAFVLNSYASGGATGGNNAVVGGLIGTAAYYNQGENIIQESYSTGAVFGRHGFNGGRINWQLCLHKK